MTSRIRNREGVALSYVDMFHHDARKRILVIPGTAQYDGRPCAQFRGRLRFVAEKTLEDPASTHLIVLGGKLPGDRFTEAFAGAKWIREFLQEQGIDDAQGSPRITEIPVGHSTRESFVALHEYLREHGRKEDAVEIITDPMHTLRCRLIAHEVGITATAGATPYCPSRFPARSWFQGLAHEAAGIAVCLITALFGRDKAAKLERILRRVLVFLRPSRSERVNQLR